MIVALQKVARNVEPYKPITRMSKPILKFQSPKFRKNTKPHQPNWDAARGLQLISQQSCGCKKTTCEVKNDFPKLLEINEMDKSSPSLIKIDIRINNFTFEA